jgi:hypothetical protein
MFQAAYWLLISTAIGVPLIGSLYVIVTPTHKLIESWQNWKISRSHRPLKDEHFKHLPNTLRLCKLLGIVVVFACLLLLAWIFLSLAGMQPNP